MTPITDICITLERTTINVYRKTSPSEINQEINSNIIDKVNQYRDFVIRADDRTQIQIFDLFTYLGKALGQKFKVMRDGTFQELQQRIQKLSSELLRGNIPVLTVCEEIDRISYTAPGMPEHNITANIEPLMSKLLEYQECIKSDEALKLKLSEKYKNLISVLGKYNHTKLIAFIESKNLSSTLLKPEGVKRTPSEKVPGQKQMSDEGAGDPCFGKGTEFVYGEYRSPRLRPSTSQEATNQNKHTTRLKIDHKKDYDSLTVLLTPVEQEIIAKMAQHPDVNTLCDAAEAGDMSHAIFDRENFPYLALAAFKKQKLSIENLFFISMFWSILLVHKREKIKIVKLFTEDGLVNLEIKAMLQATMPTSSHPDHVNSNNFTKEQFQKFYESLKIASPLQQQFWIVPSLEDDQTTIIEAIFNKTGTNIFNRINSTERMIPNLSMMQAFLNARYKTPVILKPILGGRDEFIDKASTGDTCFVSLPYPFKRLYNFDHVDGCKVRYDYDVTYYNFHCGDIASTVPQKHRKLFIMLANCMDKAADDQLDVYDELDEMETCCDILYSTFTDMQFKIYRQQQTPNVIDCFCQSLIKTLPANFLRKFVNQNLDGLEFTHENGKKMKAKGIEEWQVLQETLVDEITRMFINEVLSNKTLLINPKEVAEILKKLAEELTKSESISGGKILCKPLLKSSKCLQR